jgi:hypothetical protein
MNQLAPLCSILGMYGLFMLKHLVADFFLQTRWMLGKFKEGWAFVVPLAAHSGVHAVMTAGLCLFFYVAISRNGIN